MSRLCSIRQMVTPSAAVLPQQRQEALAGPGSRPDAGSSSSQSRAPDAIIRASERNFRSAYDRSIARASALVRQPGRARSALLDALSRASARADGPPGCQSQASRSVTVATFSRTVMCVNSRRSWKVRAMPSRATCPVRQAGDGLAEPDHLATIRRRVAGDQVEQRGLARAVRPDQRRDDARRAAQGHVVDGLQAAEGLRGAVTCSRISWSLLIVPPFDCSEPDRPPGRKIISSVMARP